VARAPLGRRGGTSRDYKSKFEFKLGFRAPERVVEAVKVLPDSTLSDEAFLTCMTESMMSLQFEASASGQYHFDFDYPFNLAPDEPVAGKPKAQTH
jgi:hypothetical protein